MPRNQIGQALRFQHEYRRVGVLIDAGIKARRDVQGEGVNALLPEVKRVAVASGFCNRILAPGCMRSSARKQAACPEMWGVSWAWGLLSKPACAGRIQKFISRHVMAAVAGKIQPDQTVNEIERTGAQINLLIRKTQDAEHFQYWADVLR